MKDLKIISIALIGVGITFSIGWLIIDLTAPNLQISLNQAKNWSENHHIEGIVECGSSTNTSYVGGYYCWITPKDARPMIFLNCNEIGCTPRISR